jgi:hypothetical protein
LTWDGTTDEGARARDGVYRVRVRLSRGRTITVPNTITLDTHSPVVHVVQRAAPRVFSPDGDGRSDGIRIRYSLSEAGHARLYVNDELVVRGHSRATTGGLAWYGRIHGVRVRPGRYRLALGAVDLAGNVAPQVSVGVVRLRFVTLPRHVYRVRAGRRFTVRASADARTLTFRVGRRTVAAGRVARLRAPDRPGRYRLVVTAGRHRTRGVVLVRR